MATAFSLGIPKTASLTFVTDSLNRFSTFAAPDFTRSLAPTVQAHKMLPSTTNIIYSVIFLALSFLIILILDYYWYLERKRSIKGIPVVPEGTWKSPYLTWNREPVDYEELIEEAYYKYTKNGQAFALMWPRPAGSLIILPPQSGKDYYNLPPKHCGFQQIAINDLYLDDVFKSDWRIYTSAIAASRKVEPMKLFGKIASREIDSIMPKIFPGTSKREWHTCKATEALWTLVIRVTGSLFFPHPNAWDIGDEMGEVMFALGEAINIRRRSPNTLDWFVRNLSPTTISFKRKLRNLKKRLRLEFKRYLNDAKNGKHNKDGELGSLFMTLTVQQVLRKTNRARGHEYDMQDGELDQISDALLFIYIAISGPVWNMTCWMVIRAIRHSECIAPIRDELKTALESSKGEWSFDTFKQTPRFESFTREILRYHPSNETAGARYVHKPVYFPSLGITIEPDTRITLLSRLVQRDSDVFADGTSFNPNRFYDEDSGTCDSRGKTASDTWLPFGAGNVVCPGKELGTALCQIMFAKILMSYDLEFRGRDIPLARWEHAEYVANPEISIAAREVKENRALITT